MVNISPKDIENLNDEQKCVFFFFLLEYGTAGFAIGEGANLLTQISTSCSGFRFLGLTLVLIGVGLILLAYISCALARNTGAALGKSACCTLPLLVVLASLGIFALVVSSKGGGKSIHGLKYKEYYVESYSNWMVKRVNHTYNWDKYYKNGVVKNHVCKKFGQDYQLDTVDEFHQRDLEPFESGCCKPPEECNFNYTSPAVWVKPNNGNYSNMDCNKWENDPNILCYNCQSCKAAFLQDLKSHYFVAGLIFVLLAAKQLLLGLCMAGFMANS